MASNAPSKRRTILFMTNSEHGQANVILGTVHELLQQPNVDIHIASFAPLKARAEALYEWHQCLGSISSTTSTLTFHTIAGAAMVEAILRNHDNQFMAHEPSFAGALEAYKLVPEWLSAWDPPEYIAGFEESMRIINDVKPDVIVIDFLLSQAIDACRVLKKNWVVLTPNTGREILPQLQPVSHMFFKYPAMGTNFPFPLPWSKVFHNIYLQFNLILNIVMNPRLKAVAKYRNEHGAPGTLPSFEPYNAKNYYLSSSLPSLEYPYPVMPSNFKFCGPIVCTGPPVSECDPELAAWLAQAPTLLINLGTINTYSSESLSKFTQVLKTLLTRNTTVQVLWKIKIADEPGEILQAELGKFVESGRLRVVSWLKPELSVVLETGHVVCSIHHGGANSFFEAVRAGIPHIILPAWLDCYAFATIAEHYGCAIFGNKESAPKVDVNDLEKALFRVLGDDETPADPLIAEKAKQLGQEAAKAGGRALAAQKLLEFCDNGGQW